MSLDVCLEENGEEVFSHNITHNLAKMANAAGIYKALWYPDENGLTKAGQVADMLRPHLVPLLDGEEALDEFNPSNGWGNYDGLVKFVLAYYRACRKYPNADVRVCR